MNEFKERLEAKKRELREERAKQASATATNFISKHRYTIMAVAGVLTGVVIGSIWHKSAAIVYHEPEQIAKADNWDGNEHCFDADGYFNWKRDLDDKWSLTFILEPTDPSTFVTPEEFNNILELLRKDYQDDYAVMDLCDALSEKYNGNN